MRKVVDELLKDSKELVQRCSNCVHAIGSEHELHCKKEFMSPKEVAGFGIDEFEFEYNYVYCRWIRGGVQHKDAAQEWRDRFKGDAIPGQCPLGAYEEPPA